MRRLLLFPFFVFIATAADAQLKRADHWYFGWQAGIDFSSGFPVADTTGVLSSIEGSSSVSDTLGNLLFSSNGETVWNRNHQVMPNGGGLAGNQSCVQSCLIVPLPQSDSLYYVFTNGWNGSSLQHYTFYYSIVDMSLDGGWGDVVPSAKNIPLFDTCGEDMAGTLHCNARDYWIVARKAGGNGISDFYVYKLDASGLSAPVVQPFHCRNNWVGNLCFSQDGSLLSFSDLDSVMYVFDFNKLTGTLSVRDSIVLAAHETVYATAISPGNAMLYASIWDNAAFPGDTNYCYVSQFDLNAGNIPASRTDLDSVLYFFGSPNGYGFFGRLQPGPDQRIYVSRWNQDNPYVTNPNTPYSLDSIDVIANPDLPGLSCGFQRNFLFLNGKPAQIGLPNFVSNFTAPSDPVISCETGWEETAASVLFRVFPNPFSSQAVLQSPQPLENATLLIENVFGQTVKKIEHVSGDTVTLTRETLPGGLYFVRIRQGNKMTGTVKLMIGD